MRTRLIFAPLLFALLVRAGDSDQWTLADEERFLTNAQIETEATTDKGLTKSLKATMTDGQRTHKAHIQTIDIYMPLFKGKDGSREEDFKDSWKFNVAAYRLAKLLSLTNMVPACVQRTVDGKPAAVDWWVDGVAMDERDRVTNHTEPPDMIGWNRQMDTIRIFDQLIYNMDRSQENLLITNDWKVWMIDHTRAFRKWTTLRNPAAITHCEPNLLKSLQALRRDDVQRDLGPYLTVAEIDGLMARRDLIVQKLTGQAAPAASAAHSSRSTTAGGK